MNERTAALAYAKMWYQDQEDERYDGLDDFLSILADSCCLVSSFTSSDIVGKAKIAKYLEGKISKTLNFPELANLGIARRGCAPLRGCLCLTTITPEQFEHCDLEDSVIFFTIRSDQIVRCDIFPESSYTISRIECIPHDPSL